ncbi:CxxxxCH/CxxCH domain-containing protein [Planktothricoides raciborskii]
MSDRSKTCSGVNCHSGSALWAIDWGAV